MSVTIDRKQATDTPTAVKPKKKRRSPIPYWLLVPAIAILVIGTGYPTGWQLVNSFREYGLAQQFGKLWRRLARSRPSRDAHASPGTSDNPHA